MFGSNPTIQTGTIVKTSTSVGVKLPAEVTAAYETATRVIREAQQLYPKGGLAEPVYAALSAGRDPATDPEVQRTYLAMQLGAQGITQGVENIASEELRVAFSKHAETIVTAWTKPFGQAATALQTAHARLGNVQLDDTVAVLEVGGDAAEVWAKAQTAVTRIDAILAAWAELAALTRLANVSALYPALRLLTTDATRWRDLELTRRRIGPWEATTLGLTLSLPTLAEYSQRVRDLERQTAQQAMAEQPVDESREAVRNWGRKVAATDARRAVTL